MGLPQQLKQNVKNECKIVLSDKLQAEFEQQFQQIKVQQNNLQYLQNQQSAPINQNQQQHNALKQPMSYIKKLGNFKIYSDLNLESYQKDSFKQSDEQTENKLSKVTKRIAKVQQQEKIRNENCRRRIEKNINMWLYRNVQKIRVNYENEFMQQNQNKIKLINSAAGYKQLRQELYQYIFQKIPKSQYLESYDFINKYPNLDNIMNVSSIPDIQYKVIYRKLVQPYDHVDEEIDQYNLNFVIKIKQMMLFIQNFFKTPYEYEQIGAKIDMDPSMLKILYDLLNKILGIGSMQKDLRRRTNTRIQKLNEYIETISSEIKNIIKYKQDNEFVDYKLQHFREMFINMQEFVQHYYQYKNSLYQQEEQLQILPTMSYNNQKNDLVLIDKSKSSFF